MAYNSVTAGSVSGKRDFLFTVKELSGGLCEKERELSDSQTKNLYNMEADDGYLKTRDGFKSISALEGTYHSCYEKDFFGSSVIHCGTKIYRFDGSTVSVLLEDVADANSFFYSMNSCLYLVTAERKCYEVTKEFSASEKEPYVPNIMVAPSFSSSEHDIDQAVNMCTKRVRCTYINGEHDSVIGKHYTPVAVDPNEPIKLYADGVLLGKAYRFSVSNKMIEVQATPYYDTFPEKMELEFSVKDDDGMLEKYQDKIYNSTLAFCFGGNDASGTRAFITGNEKYPGEYFRSELKEPLYFPDTMCEILGDGTENVTAVGKRYDKQYLFTDRHIYAMSYSFSSENGADFAVSNVNSAVGCTMPGTVAQIDNTLVFADKNTGIYILQSTDIFDELNVMHISSNISGQAGQAFASGNSFCSCDHNRKYYIFNGEYLYLWDYGKTPYYTSGDHKKAEERLSWHRFSDIPECKALICPANTLAFIGGKDNPTVYVFDDTLCEDITGEEPEKKAVHPKCCFLTKEYDLDLFHTRKRLRYFSFDYICKDASGAAVSLSFFGDGKKYCSFDLVLSKLRGRKKLKLPAFYADRFSVAFDITQGGAGFRNIIFHAHSAERTNHSV